MPTYPRTLQSLPASDPAGPAGARGCAQYRFGQFSLYPARKLLLRGDTPVVLGGRAFDLLVALVAHAGEVVGHQALVSAVWPHAVVEENGLRVHVSALRKALGDSPADRYILTVLGSGYRFVKPVSRRAAMERPGQEMPILAVREGHLIGRESALAELDALLGRANLVCLVGPGGVGKTALARACAAAHAGHHADGCHFIDFGAVDAAARVPAYIANALGLAPAGADPVAAICKALCRTQTLLVFDNCEHVVAAVALCARRITETGPGVTVLATSREALGLATEVVYHVAPLALPGAGLVIDCAEAQSLSAVALFVARAQANSSRFALTAANLPSVVALCEQLDGLPLALELAAARVEGLGVAGLLARLDDMFGLLTRSRRLASPRHAGLAAMLDWGYRLLDQTERAVLMRLSCFEAAFATDAAVRVCAFGAVTPADVRRALPALAARSLLTLDTEAGVARYRCLHTTRRYARQHLAASGDARAVGRRHADHLVTLLPHWCRRHGGSNADLLAALDWAFGAGGEPELGLALCAALPLPSIEAGMVDAFRRRIETALDFLEHDAGAAQHERLELRLLCVWVLASIDVTPPPELCARMQARLLRRAGHAAQRLAGAVPRRHTSHHTLS